MAMEVSEEVAGLFFVLTGERFPDANEDHLRALAAEWRTAARGLRDLHAGLKTAVTHVWTTFEGGTERAFADRMAKWVDGAGIGPVPGGDAPSNAGGARGRGGGGFTGGEISAGGGEGGMLGSMAFLFDSLADFLDKLAEDVEYTKLVIIYQLTLLLFEIALAYVLSPFTGGAVWVYLEAKFLIVGRLMKHLLGKLLLQFAVAWVIGSAFQLLVDVLAQSTQFGMGTRDDWNEEHTRTAAEVAALGAGISLFFAPLQGPISNGVNSILSTMFREKFDDFGRNFAIILGSGLHEATTDLTYTGIKENKVSDTWYGSLTAGMASGGAHVLGEFLFKIAPYTNFDLEAWVQRQINPHGPLTPDVTGPLIADVDTPDLDTPDLDDHVADSPPPSDGPLLDDLSDGPTFSDDPADDSFPDDPAPRDPFQEDTFFDDSDTRGPYLGDSVHNGSSPDGPTPPLRHPVLSPDTSTLVDSPAPPLNFPALSPDSSSLDNPPVNAQIEHGPENVIRNTPEAGPGGTTFDDGPLAPDDYWAKAELPGGDVWPDDSAPFRTDEWWNQPATDTTTTATADRDGFTQPESGPHRMDTGGEQPIVTRDDQPVVPDSTRSDLGSEPVQQPIPSPADVANPMPHNPSVPNGPVSPVSLGAPTPPGLPETTPTGAPPPPNPAPTPPAPSNVPIRPPAPNLAAAQAPPGVARGPRHGPHAPPDAPRPADRAAPPVVEDHNLVLNENRPGNRLREYHLADAASTPAGRDWAAFDNDAPGSHNPNRQDNIAAVVSHSLDNSATNQPAPDPAATQSPVDGSDTAGPHSGQHTPPDLPRRDPNRRPRDSRSRSPRDTPEQRGSLRDREQPTSRRPAAPSHVPQPVSQAGPVTEQQARHYFDELRRATVTHPRLGEVRIAYDYPEAGCDIRAHLYVKKLLEHGVDVKKVFVERDDGLKVRSRYALGATRDRPRTVTWSYHVAPMIQVDRGDGQPVDMVLDPALGKGVLPKQAWLAEVGATIGSIDTQVSITDASVLNPPGGTDPVPASLEEADQVVERWLDDAYYQSLEVVQRRQFRSWYDSLPAPAKDKFDELSSKLDEDEMGEDKSSEDELRDFHDWFGGLDEARRARFGADLGAELSPLSSLKRPWQELANAVRPHLRRLPEARYVEAKWNADLILRTTLPMTETDNPRVLYPDEHDLVAYRFHTTYFDPAQYLSSRIAMDRGWTPQDWQDELPDKIDEIRESQEQPDNWNVSYLLDTDLAEFARVFPNPPPAPPQAPHSLAESFRTVPDPASDYTREFSNPPQAPPDSPEPGSRSSPPSMPGGQPDSRSTERGQRQPEWVDDADGSDVRAHWGTPPPGRPARPPMPAALPRLTPPPDGWIRVKSEANGRFYFVNPNDVVKSPVRNRSGRVIGITFVSPTELLYRSDREWAESTDVHDKYVRTMPHEGHIARALHSGRADAIGYAPWYGDYLNGGTGPIFVIAHGRPDSITTFVRSGATVWYGGQFVHRPQEWKGVVDGATAWQLLRSIQSFVDLLSANSNASIAAIICHVGDGIFSPEFMAAMRQDEFGFGRRGHFGHSEVIAFGAPQGTVVGAVNNAGFDTYSELLDANGGIRRERAPGTTYNDGEIAAHNSINSQHGSGTLGGPVYHDSLPHGDGPLLDGPAHGPENVVRETPEVGNGPAPSRSDGPGLPAPASVTLTRLDELFASHIPERVMATDLGRGGIRPLSAEDQVALSEAVNLEHAAGGALPTFHRDLPDEPPYEVRIRQVLDTVIDGVYEDHVTSQPPRTDGNLIEVAEIDRIAGMAKRVTDAVFGGYQTQPELVFGVNIKDQFEVSKEMIAGSEQKAHTVAWWEVDRMITDDSDLAAIHDEHGAVPSRDEERALLDAVYESVIKDRRGDLLAINQHWPGEEKDGVITIQRFRDLDQDPEANRNILYNLFATVIHEYLHTLEHPSYGEVHRRMSQERGGEARGGRVLREGMTDYFAKMVWDGLSFDADLRATIEGSFHDPGDPTGHEVPTPERYPEWENAERVVGIIGIGNAMAAYFGGQIGLIGQTPAPAHVPTSPLTPNVAAPVRPAATAPDQQGPVAHHSVSYVDGQLPDLTNTDQPSVSPAPPPGWIQVKSYGDGRTLYVHPDDVVRNEVRNKSGHSIGITFMSTADPVYDSDKTWAESTDVHDKYVRTLPGESSVADALNSGRSDAVGNAPWSGDYLHGGTGPIFVIAYGNPDSIVARVRSGARVWHEGQFERPPHEWRAQLDATATWQLLRSMRSFADLWHEKRDASIVAIICDVGDGVFAPEFITAMRRDGFVHRVHFGRKFTYAYATDAGPGDAFVSASHNYGFYTYFEYLDANGEPLRESALGTTYDDDEIAAHSLISLRRGSGPSVGPVQHHSSSRADDQQPDLTHGQVPVGRRGLMPPGVAERTAARPRVDLVHAVWHRETERRQLNAFPTREARPGADDAASSASRESDPGPVRRLEDLLPRDEWYRLYLDPRHFGFAERFFPFDPGSYYDHEKSPGFQASMMAAYERFLDSSDIGAQRLNFEVYREMHDAVNSQLPHQSEWSGGELSTGFPLRAGEPSVDLLEERVAGRLLLFVEGVSPGWEDNPIAVLDTEQDPPYIFTRYTRDEVEGLVDAVFDRFHDERSRATSDIERFKAIGRAVRTLQIMHPSGDTNRRLNVHLLLPRLLLEAGFEPVVFKDLDQLFQGGRSLDQIAQALDRGQSADLRSGRVRATEPEYSSDSETSSIRSDNARPASAGELTEAAYVTAKVAANEVLARLGYVPPNVDSPSFDTLSDIVAYVHHTRGHEGAVEVAARLADEPTAEVDMDLPRDYLVTAARAKLHALSTTHRDRVMTLAREIVMESQGNRPDGDAGRLYDGFVYLVAFRAYAESYDRAIELMTELAGELASDQRSEASSSDSDLLMMPARPARGGR